MVLEGAKYIAAPTAAPPSGWRDLDTAYAAPPRRLSNAFLFASRSAAFLNRGSGDICLLATVTNRKAQQARVAAGDQRRSIAPLSVAARTSPSEPRRAAARRALATVDRLADPIPVLRLQTPRLAGLMPLTRESAVAFHIPILPSDPKLPSIAHQWWRDKHARDTDRPARLPAPRPTPCRRRRRRRVARGARGAL